MNFAPLLLLSPDVPARAKDALRLATRASPADRERLFLHAARELASSTDLDCAEARDLVGLDWIPPSE
jgi:hypothetical protein